jgi:RecB family endonuclease NucS
LKKLINALLKKGDKKTDLPKRYQRDDHVRQLPPLPKFKNELEFKTFLAANLDYLEPGLRLFKHGEWTGVEVPCQFSEWSKPGLIDILAIDSDGSLVVIEIKMDGRAPAYGQLLGYMAWMRRWASTDDRGGRTRAARKVRGIVVCKRAAPMLVFLVREHPEHPVTVYETRKLVSLTTQPSTA